MPIETLQAYIAEHNIADKLDADLLMKIGRSVVEGYDEDLGSRSEWEDRNEEYMKLASQLAESKSTPWPGAANVKYPLLTTAALQFAARAYPALIPGTDVVRGRVIGYDPDGIKQEKAVRIGKHMSYQLIEEMEDWEEDMDKLCIVIPILGCAFKKTYYDPLSGRNRSELVMPQDLVVNYYAKCLEDAYRKTHILELNKNQVRERILNGIYRDVELNDPLPRNMSGKDERTGISPASVTDETTPFVILEQHTYWDLDEDGYEEPYIITVEENSRTVLRIVARYDTEGIKQNEREEIVRIEPIEYFTKFSFVPNPDGGFYDIGFGSLLGPINDTINTVINQLLDAGTLSNLQAGFLSRGIRIKGGTTKFQPGEWKTVNSTGDDLKKGIFPLPIREPSAVLFNLLGLMIDAGQRLSMTMDSMVGENPGQNQKATTTLAVIEQGMKVFNAIYKRLHRALKKEYKKLFRLNRIYLPEEVYFTILDPMGEKAAQLKRVDYDETNADVIPSSDPNVATEQQKLAKAVGLLELLQLGTINVQEATKRVLEAQNQYGIEQLMSVPKPGPSIEELELQLKQQEMVDASKREWFKLQLEALKANDEAVKIRAEAIRAIADAEAKEKGTQIEQYRAEVERMLGERDAEAKKLKAQSSGV